MLILTDNGSLEPASTLALRALAAQVAAIVGEPVAPVSLLHSSGIDPEKLGGEPAAILEPFLETNLREGRTRFRILPAFFGPSLALTDYLPKRLAALQRRFPALDAAIAPCLGDDEAGERIVADSLLRRIRAHLADTGEPATVIVTDHGSPAPAVTAVRDRIAGRVRDALGATVADVIAASMERRDGPEYAFNEPLLRTALREARADRPVIVALQFLFPGRHAGPGGDIARICADSGRTCRIASTIGNDDGIAALLASRARR